MDKIKKVYEITWLIELIYRESDKLLTKVVDPTQFEERCLKDIGEYLSKCDSHKNNKKHLIRLVKRKHAEALRRHKKEESYNIPDINYVNEDGDEVEYEPVDVLADVESEVMAKEMTALLAQDDHRKKVILGNWSKGNDNNTDISRLLAQSNGGNIERYRKYIQRFRAECREILATVI